MATASETRLRFRRVQSRHLRQPAIAELRDDAEAPRRAVWSREPCATCRNLQQRGVMLMSVRDGEKDGENPYRTGRMCVVAEQWVNRVVDEPMRAQLLRKRCAFIEDSVWRVLGLPMEDVE